MNASLSYAIRLENRGMGELADIIVQGDLVSAHAELPRERQLAQADAEMPVLHRLPGLAPGEAAVLHGTVVLPREELRPIRSGRTVLFVPLLRLRIAHSGSEEFRTLLIGLPPRESGGPLLPIRLDRGLMTHRPLLQRSFA